MSNTLKPSARAYGRITDAIVRRQLVPGSFITQRELVEISEMPLGSVREAIPRLEADGIFTSTRQRGLQIASISPSFIRNAYQLRIALEKEAFSVLLERISDETIAEMRQQHQSILDDLQNEVSDELLERAQQTDWDLHDWAVDALQNEVISEIYRVNAVKIRMATQPQLRITADNLRRVMNEHMAIIAGMAKRDTSDTIRALERHLRNSKSLALGQELEDFA